MEPKLVYRALRKVSHWVVGNFYEEVQVQGSEHVPKQGPLIIASTHHNEIIDIATLAVTIPHGRQLSFWGKASMFDVPVWGWIMSSSGAIPVRRSPDSTKAKAPSHGAAAAPTQSALFEATSKALHGGAAVGCFVEGTSYTEPGIVQVKDGAAWAAIEYIRWIRQHQTKSRKEILTVIPVGIVYTDKTQYRSRVVVVYGQPILVDPSDQVYLPSHASEEESRAAVKRLTKQIEASLRAISINASDWETLQAANSARAIMWREPERPLPLSNWVPVSQTLIRLFENPKPAPVLKRAKSALVAYSSLLLNASLPNHLNIEPPTSLGLLRQFIFTLLHPKLILFIPVAIVHVPMYVFGALGARIFVNKGEDETVAECKGVIGGVGLGISYAAAGWASLKILNRAGTGELNFGVKMLHEAARSLAQTNGIKGLLAKVAAVYITARFLNSWHNALVSGNIKRLRLLHTSWELFRGSRTSALPEPQLSLYTVPPPRIVNVFIKALVPQPGPSPPKVNPLKLIKPIVKARRDAMNAMNEMIGEMAGSPEIIALKRVQA